MEQQVEPRKACGHKRNVGNSTFSCTLRPHHEGKHYEAFTWWNDLGETGPAGEVEKRERAMVETEMAKARPTPPTDVTAAPQASNARKARTKASERPAAPLASAEAAAPVMEPPVEDGAEPIRPTLLQGEGVKVRLRDVLAFDHENPRQQPLVEEARRLMAKGCAHSGDPAYCDLLERVSDLYTSIPSVGLIEPFVVEKIDDGRFRLRAGWRRMTVLLLIYGEDCTVYATTTAESKRSALASLAENVSRRDMAWHLQAISFAELQKDYTTRELFEATGVSIPQINNLVRVRNKLHPSIWEVVCKWGGTPRALALPEMLKLAAKEPDEQLETWKRMNEKGASGALPSSAKESHPVIDPNDLMMPRPSTPAYRAMTEREVTDLLAVMRQAVSAHEQAKSPAAQGLRFALGALEAVTGKQSAEVEALRAELARSRQLTEQQSKRAQSKDARATTSAEVHAPKPPAKAGKQTKKDKAKPNTPPPRKSAPQAAKGGR